VSRREPSPVRIRAIRAGDACELQAFYAGLSAASRQTRFLTVSMGVSDALSRSFCNARHRHQQGFVAVVGGNRVGVDRIVGHLCLEPDGADAAEVAIAVADAFQRQGIGRMLLAAGVAWALGARVSRFTATMSSGNAAIHQLLVGLGLPARMKYSGAGVAEITIDLAADTVARGHRWRLAEA
jgi:GNAT superfamily N-acetyltransferase